ncbi:MAG: hypothetical protein L0220_03435 [Acidobacteria bacterium]|nr:hypothetical protein [Acidobacteriota bacterium]
MANKIIPQTAECNELFEHNYQKEISLLIQAGIIESHHKALTQVDIRHDNWCGIFSRERCNCHPDIIERSSGRVLNAKVDYR